MKAHTPTEAETDLDELERQEQDNVLHYEALLAESQRRLAAIRARQNHTLPPSDVIQTIMAQKLHDEMVSKKEARNYNRVQGRGILLVVLLAVAAFALLWWGMKVMHGG